MTILNIAAYRFVPLATPARWVDALRERADARALKGTIIVADEGINLFLAGEPDAIDGYLDWLATDARFTTRDGAPAFAALDVKRSRSANQPFRRLRVKHRPEIVTMRRPTIRPADGRAPTIAPQRLAAWLAQGHDDARRPVVLLDTRNAFEVAHGTFDGARHLDLARFDDFPAAVERLRDELGDATIVAFCTGGIRCEKAALYMRDAGFARTLQLDGGILNYFASVGGTHWHGDCFVFDERVALTSELAPCAEPAGAGTRPDPDLTTSPRARGARLP